MSSTVEYLCPFVPAELISAWGLEPIRIKLSGSNSDSVAISRRNISAGVCPIAESMLDEFSQSAAAGVIFSTTCDQMRRVREIYDSRPGSTESFLLNVPASWQDEVCFEYYLSELERLGVFLESIGGQRPNNKTLAAVARREAGLRLGNMSPTCENTSDVRLAIVGSVLRQEDKWIFEYLCDCGGQIVLNATNNGEMIFPDSVLPDYLDDDPLHAIARVYFDMPHPHQRPDSKFFDHLISQINRYDIQGVILVRMSWCDTAHGLAGRLKAGIGVPMLELAEAEQAARVHMQNRISAFMEMLT